MSCAQTIDSNAKSYSDDSETRATRRSHTITGVKTDERLSPLLRAARIVSAVHAPKLHRLSHALHAKNGFLHVGPPLKGSTFQS